MEAKKMEAKRTALELGFVERGPSKTTVRIKITGEKYIIQITLPGGRKITKSWEKTHVGADQCRAEMWNNAAKRQLITAEMAEMMDIMEAGSFTVMNEISEHGK